MDFLQQYHALHVSHLIVEIAEIYSHTFLAKFRETNICIYMLLKS